MHGIKGRRAILAAAASTAAALAALPLLVIAPSAAAASPPVSCPSQDWNPLTQICTLTAAGPSTAPTTTSARSAGSGGGVGTCTSTWSTDMPCEVAGEGWWDQSLECYVAYASPQPPADDPVWGTHKPGDGAIYRANCPVQVEANHKLTQGYDYWSATPPAGIDAVAVELAQQAVAEMQMDAASINLAPRRGTMAVVGIPVWIWTTKTAQTWGPQTRTVAAEGVSVTATGHVSSLTIETGDGASVSCPDGGEAYTTADGASAAPECGHTYTVPSTGQIGGVYRLRATSVWSVTWTATPGGDAGAMAFTFTDALDLAVGTAQALVVNGGVS